jgi:beta-lactam-binding protein with PASTA domain/tRNA A-37 threonylcarbamoyl transferase component Bud32
MDTTLSDPLIGRLLDGRYRVEAPIAHGGMASVYTALDTRLDRIVALKVMHSALARDEGFVARFNREAKAAARLTHPNVVAVYDQGEDGGSVFLTMEYVEGRTLRDLMRERGRLTPAQALSILEPVVSALSAAHGAGLVHRDVKPENVLLADDGRIKVADFGLARAVAAADHTHTTNVLIGTVAYLAPEQVERGIADARSDVYAAGVMLYEMLVGKPPYDGETAWAVASRHVHEDVPAPSTVVGTLPKEVDDLVVRATSRDAADRPADGRELLEEVRRVRGVVGVGAADLTVITRPDAPASAHTQVLSGPITPPPAKPAARQRGWWSRWSGGRLVVAIVTVLALIAAGLGYYFAIGQYKHVPNVINKDPVAAASTLQHDGFKVRVGDKVFSASVASGLVASTSPSPGHRIHKGGTITIYPSKGIEQYAVPDLRNKTQDEADAALRDLKLEPTFTSDYSPTVKSGLVIGTEPKTGVKLAPGSKVLVHISKGPQPVHIPDETGQTQDTANTVLTGLGLKVHATQVFSDTVPVGTVVDQNPKNANGHQGDTVELSVSKGPQTIPVPNVVGENYHQAKSQLEALGFQVNVDRPFGGNQVQGQNPRPGTQARKGSTVTLVVF